MTDVHDILGVGGERSKKRDTPPIGEQPQKEKKAAKPKHGSISRELSMLGGVPPVAPTIAFDGIGTKRLAARKAAKWRVTPFTNPARADDLKLSHWCLERDANKAYSFVKFNKASDVPTYTDADYKTYLEHPEWTREDTDTLMNLAREYGVRFIIMHDRSKMNKSIEERFYDVCGKLLKNRDGQTEHPYLFITYNKEQELKRKTQMERLYTRPVEIIKEEEELTVELKRIEQNRKKYLKEKGRMSRLLKATSATAQSASNPGELSSTTRVITANDLFRIKYAGHNALASINPALTQQINEVLAELGICMFRCSQAFAELVQDVLMLLDLQRCLALREYMVKVSITQQAASLMNE